MTKPANFLRRALDAVVESRTRQAERFVSQFERRSLPDEPHLNRR